MAKLVLGRQIIDTGPCTDGQAGNMGAIASLLDALGNPGQDPGPGPEDPITEEPVDQGTPVDPVYQDEDGNLVVPGADPSDPPIIITGGGTGGGAAFSVTLYLMLKGTATVQRSDPNFILTVTDVVESFKVPVPAATTDPVVPATITVQNSPKLETATQDVVYARYNTGDGLWYPDSLQNAAAFLRGRLNYDETEFQVIGHSTDDHSVDWITGRSLNILVTLQ